MICRVLAVTCASVGLALPALCADEIRTLRFRYAVRMDPRHLAQAHGDADLLRGVIERDLLDPPRRSKAE